MNKTITNSTTLAIVTYLNFYSFKAWAQYNGAVYSAKRQMYLKNPHKQKGVPDIIGYHKINGLFIGVEIKTGDDKLSVEQIKFLNDLERAGGIAIVAKTFDDFEKQFLQIKQLKKL